MIVPSDLNEGHLQLENLETLCHNFHVSMKLSIYKDIAAKLRVLLTGSSGDQGFVTKFLPTLELLPLRITVDPAMPQDLLVFPGDGRITPSNVIRMGAGSKYGGAILVQPGPTVTRLRLTGIFLSTGSKLPLASWLEQPFLFRDLTIRKFIQNVANKDGGAHKSAHPVIDRLDKAGRVHWHAIGAIAQEVLPQLKEQFHTAYPTYDPESALQ